MEDKWQKCTRCMVQLQIIEYSKKRNGESYKQCKYCNEKMKETRSKNRCEHNRDKYSCKECGGSAFCIHNRMKTSCKDCGGGSRCEHGRIRQYCRKCGGNGMCEHNKIRSVCKKCEGGSICPHNLRKTICLKCEGGALCKHKRIKSCCKVCGGGSYCEHGKRRTVCTDCKGGGLCKEHNRQKHWCKDCNPDTYLVNLCRVSVYRAIHESENLVKEHKSLKYIGCTKEHLQRHLKSQITQEMKEKGFHIDHIKPISRFNLSKKEELLKCCNWKNLQLLTGEENLKKSNRWNKKQEEIWCRLMEI